MNRLETLARAEGVELKPGQTRLAEPPFKTYKPNHMALIKKYNMTVMPTSYDENEAPHRWMAGTRMEGLNPHIEDTPELAIEAAVLALEALGDE